jgi:hypothetical protein
MDKAKGAPDRRPTRATVCYPLDLTGAAGTGYTPARKSLAGMMDLTV